MDKSRWLRACAGVALACSMSVPALAQERGVYLGGSFGQAEVNGLCSDLNLLVTGLGGTVASCDEKDSAFKLFGGYRFNRNFAVEGSYFDYGNAKVSGQTFGVPFNVSGDTTAWGAAAVGILPLNERFSLFGKAGLLITDFSVAGSGFGGTGTDDDQETGLHIGIGAVFNVTRQFAIRAEWERNDEAEIDMLSIGVQVNF